MDRKIKTNAMRILDNSKVSYEVLSYAVDEEHLDAIHVAKEADIPIDQVFKTIVMITNDKKIFVFCTPGEYEISLKKARELTNSKTIDLIKLDQLQKLTGGSSVFVLVNTLSKKTFNYKKAHRLAVLG